MSGISRGSWGIWVRGGVLSLLAVSLFALWLRHGDNAELRLPAVSWSWAVAAFGTLFVVFASYIGRTAVVLGLPLRHGPRWIVRPLLLAHAVAVLGIPLAGGVGEVLLLARRLGRPMRAVLLALLFRMSLNVAGVGLLAAVALFRYPGWAAATGALFVVLPFAFFPALRLARLVPKLREALFANAFAPPRPSLPGIAVLLVVSTAESALAAFALLGVGRAVGLSLELPVALGAFAMVEVASYSPLPLSSLGLHHWGITGAVSFLAPELSSPSMLALAHHGMILAFGALAALAFALLPGLPAVASEKQY